MPLYGASSSSSGVVLTSFVSTVAAAITVTESTATSLGLTDLSLTGVATGDVLLFTLSAFWLNAAENAFLDVLIGGSNRFISSGTTTKLDEGVLGWRGTNGQYDTVGATYLYTVQATDHTAGSWTGDLVGWSASAADKVLHGGANAKLQYGVVLLKAT